MIEPTGYTALDLIGFTDRGAYDPDAYYVKNDITSVGNTKWRCLIDDTHNVPPTEGANWTIYLESATSLAGMSDVTLTSPKNGDGLVHDGNDWKNIPIMTKEQWKKNGAYNICPNEAATQVIDGVVCTVNSDKTVTLNGTVGATGLVLDIPNRNTYNSGKGTYKLVGCPSGGSESTYMIGVRMDGSWSYPDTGDGAVLNTTSGITAVIIRAMPGTVINNLVFKPMITTDLNATYDDYVPHAKTNRELTENMNELQLVSTSFYNGYNADYIQSGLHYCYGYKMGDIKYLAMYIGLLAGTIPAGAVLFTLNTEYNPKSSNFSPTMPLVSSDGSVLGYLQVDSGRIITKSALTLSNPVGYIRANVMYI